jgi:type I restriction enzyme S subunit
MTEEAKKHLPSGWQLARLQDVVDINPAKPTGEISDEDLVSFVPMAAVEEQTGRLDASRFRLWAEVKKGYTYFQEGDVLFAKITPCMENGKAAMAVGLHGGRGTGSTEFHVLRPETTEVNPRYILHFVLQESYRKDARAKMKGAAGQLRVPEDFVAGSEIPLAPSAEQDRIVAEIEKQFTRLDAATASLQQVRAKLDRYRASILKAACEGRLVPNEAELASAQKRDYEPAARLIERILADRRARWEQDQLQKMRDRRDEPKNDKWKSRYQLPAQPDTTGLPPLPEGWIWSSLGQLFDVHIGATPSRAKPEYWNGDIPWVSSGEVAFCRIKATKEYITELGLNNSSTTMHPPGTVLLGMIGEGKTRGQAAILDISACNNQNSAAIRVADSGLPPEYIYRFLESQYESTRNAGSGNNQPALNKSIVQSLLFPVPPQAEQERIVTELEAHLSVADELVRLTAKSVLRAARLRQSILKRAFAGQLVTQDPRDEPAAVLLDRIRAEREQATTLEAGKAKGKRGRRKAMAQNRPAATKTIIDALSEAKTSLSPEQLFSETGHRPETIDEFYSELKDGVVGGQIEELRTGDDGVLLRVKQA